MLNKLSLLVAAAGGALALIPTSASAQSWGVYYSYGRPYYGHGYDRRYYDNYDRPYYRSYNDDYYHREYWRERRERWERERARRYWTQERWEHQHRWHRDDDDDDN